MRAGRVALERAVDSVVEGSGDLDWGLITIELDNERDREIVGYLRLLAQISDVERAAADGLDDRELRVRARSIAKVVPIDALNRSHAAEATGTEALTASVEIGQPTVRWGRLELVELVGRGTFGEVYRARDSQLERDVAVKLLHVRSPRLGQVDRMLHEARALARVRHPNVVIVHDAEERDGRVGICMEFIRGRTLAEIVTTQGARGASEAALIGQSVCQALAAVHAAGLIHRDIKAQNVMREDGGRVVLMDFGAGVPLEFPTRSGHFTGTPLYLAPEVLAHGEATVRSDIYSLGVLLYHLVSGEYPVRGQTPSQLVDAHRQGRMRRLRDVAPTLPLWFVQVVERAISADPDERFATAGELEAALGKRPASSVWPMVLAAGLTLAVATGVQQLWSRPGADTVSLPRVAVLPLDAGIGVDGPLAAAVTEEIYQAFAMVDMVRVISLPSAAKAKRDQPNMPKVAEVLQASTLIDGTVSEAAGQFEVKLRVFDAGSDSPRWAGTLAAARTNLGSLRRDSVMSIARALNIQLSARVVKLLSLPTGATTQAFDAYARGRALQSRARRADLEQAKIELNQALQLDPFYAPAYAALAGVHLDLGANGRRSEWAVEAQLAHHAARKALELEPQLAEAHVAMGQVAFLFDWDWQASERAFRNAIAISPSYDNARQSYANVLAARGQVDDALAELDIARRLDPFSETIDFNIVSVLQYARRFSEAETLARALLLRMPDSNRAHVQLGRILAATNRFEEAIQQFQQVVDPASGPYVEAEIASALAAANRPMEAQAMLDQLLERARSEEIPPELFSLIFLRLGHVDDALHHLELAIDQKSRRTIWLKVDPRWDPLRADPRFESLVKRSGL